MPDLNFRPHTNAVRVESARVDPTESLRVFETIVAELEQAQEAVAFSSGMLALQSAILTIVPPKGSIFVPAFIDEDYARLFDWLAQSLRIQVHRINYADEFVNDLIEQVSPSAVFCESIEQLTGYIPHINSIAEVAHASGSQLIVDNTLGAGYVTQPLTQGADLVVHASMAQLTAHHNVTGGVVAGSLELIRITRSQRDLLNVSPPSVIADFWLQGVRTLPVRMNHACKSARQVAASLEAEPYVTGINYPGLSSDPSNKTARTLLNRNTYGTLMTFDLVLEDLALLIDQLEVVKPSAAANGTRTTIFSPVTVVSAERERSDVLRTLGLRIGLEDPNDIMADISQAARYVISMDRGD